jgi:Uma2 family endonuclease
MGDAAAARMLTNEEYLAFERASPQKHEYANGEVFAMSGGSMEHSLIALNIGAELRTALAGRACRVLSSDMRIHIPKAGRYVYPDGSIVCGKPLFYDDTRDTLLNPTGIIEVLSDSSEAYDRGDKFEQYRAVTSLEVYVLASQKKPLLDVFTRETDGRWSLRSYGPGERAALDPLGCELSVDGAYMGVFEA